MSPACVRSGSERIYGFLLRLYPAAFRRQAGPDLLEFFRDQIHAVRGRRFGVARLWLRALPDLFTSAFLERWTALRAPVCAPVAPLASRPGDSAMNVFLLELRYALRLLRQAPLFTLVAGLVVALGIGAVTTIFSAANGLAFRPLPGAGAPDRLVEIHRTQKGGRGSHSASYPYYRALRDRRESLSGLAAWSMLALTVRTNDQEGTRALGNLVSGNYFEVLGVRPAAGRFFVPDEDRVPGARPVVVLSHAFWSRAFGSDPGVVGRPVSINSHPFTIVGVAPRGFHGVYAALSTDVWVPMMMQGQVRGTGDLLSSAGSTWLELIGRRREGVGFDQVRAELATATAAFAGKDEPADLARFSDVSVESLGAVPAEANGPFLGFLTLLLAASGLVLAIASVNITGMLLARATARRREILVRLSLGASRARIVRQLLIESLVLFALGSAGGILLAEWGTRALERIPIPVDVPITLELTPDLRVLSFAVATALLSGLLFGLVPALQGTRLDLASPLRAEAPGAGRKRSRTRNALVIGQISLSLLLLVAAGLFLRALDRGQRVDPGFDAAQVATASFDTRTYGYGEERARQFYADLRTRLAGRPGVEAVSYARVLPLSGNRTGDEFRVDGAAAGPGVEGDGAEVMLFAEVDVDYFAALHMPLLSGRGFAATDGPKAAGVVIVNETLARRFFPGGGALGRTIHRGKDPLTIVGVAHDAKVASLSDGVEPFLFLPVAQSFSPELNLMVRSKGDPAGVAAMIRNEVRALDPGLPRAEVTPLSVITSLALLPQRVAALVTGLLGLVGLLLAAVGLYGVIAYSMNQRGREIGVRMALGATAGNVVQMVLKESARFVAIGLSIGIALALAATWLMKPFLFGVSATDAATYLAVSAVLTAVALLASYLPARRAAAADPMEVLRTE